MKRRIEEMETTREEGDAEDEVMAEEEETEATIEDTAEAGVAVIEVDTEEIVEEEATEDNMMTEIEETIVLAEGKRLLTKSSLRFLTDSL